VFVVSSRVRSLRQNFFIKELYFLSSKTLKPFLASKNPPYQFIFKYMFNFILRNSSLNFTRAKSICLLTGRSRSVYRMFKLSRLKVREYAHSGYFSGLSKAS
jgi:small subunit ribosomal protein S14